jgi:hypothetical protein
MNTANFTSPDELQHSTYNRSTVSDQSATISVVPEQLSIDSGAQLKTAATSLLRRNAPPESGDTDTIEEGYVGVTSFCVDKSVSTDLSTSYIVSGSGDAPAYFVTECAEKNGDIMIECIPYQSDDQNDIGEDLDDIRQVRSPGPGFDFDRKDGED